MLTLLLTWAVLIVPIAMVVCRAISFGMGGEECDFRAGDDGAQTKSPAGQSGAFHITEA